MDMPPMGGPPPPGPPGPPGEEFEDEYGPPPGPGFGDMPPDMGGGMAAATKPTNFFSIFMWLRKVLSICAILTLIGLEASIAVQNAQLKTITPVLEAANTRMKRDVPQFGPAHSSIAKRALPKIVCEYYSGFDVPAV